MLVKKKLLELPIHTCPAGDIEKARYMPNISYFYDAEVTDGILHLTLFSHLSREAEWRVFCDGQGWINYDVKHGRWGKAHLRTLGLNASERSYKHLELCQVSDRAEDAGRQLMKDRFGDKTSNKTHDLIRYLQEEKDLDKFRERKSMEDMEREKIFANWPELPNGWEERLQNGPWWDSKYCFFHKTQKDDLSVIDRLIEKELPGTSAPYIGECSVCNKTFPLDYAPEHVSDHREAVAGDMICCPHCQRKLYPKRSHLGRKKLWTGGHWAVATEREGKVYIDVLWCWRNYDKKPYQTEYRSYHRIYLDTTENKAFRWDRGGYNWIKAKTTSVPTCNYSMDSSVEEALRRTRLRYEGGLFKQHETLLAAIKLTQAPCLEAMYKQDMKMWVWEYVQNQPYIRQCINFKGKDNKEVLGMTKQELDFAKKHCRTAFSLLLFKKFRRDNKWPNEAQIEVSHSICNTSLFLNLAKKSSYAKALTYLSRQKKKHPKQRYDDILISWRDYLNECMELDYDLSDNYNLMPPDLMKAHARTMKLVSIKKNKALDEAIQTRLPALTKKYGFCADGFLIRPAECSGELKAEGEFLHHCVGGYAEKYAKGQTDILLIRSVEDPETPLVTAEYRNGKRIQVRAESNHNPYPEVTAFVEKFEQQLKAPKGKSIT